MWSISSRLRTPLWVFCSWLLRTLIILLQMGPYLLRSSSSSAPSQAFSPLVTALTQDPDRVYLEWNLLSSALSWVCRDDTPGKLCSYNRVAPEMHPRLAEVEIMSRIIPVDRRLLRRRLSISASACEGTIDTLDFLHQNPTKEDVDLDSGSHRVERDHARYHNRPTAIGVLGHQEVISILLYL